MWIRSQDRTVLVDSKRIIVAEHKVLNYAGYSQNEDLDILGKYATKERAIEVLDIIQDLMITYGVERHLGLSTYQGLICQNVYQMPSE